MATIIIAPKESRKSVAKSTSVKSEIVKIEGYSRAKLVGKYPHVKHFSAPQSKLQLDAAIRKQLLASMRLK